MIEKPSLRAVLGFFLLMAISALTAFAGQVSIEWQEDEAAFRYELQVSRNGKVVFDRRFPRQQTTWKGSLPFGFYSYRLRTFDRGQEAGLWSESVPFTVTPAPPRLLIPPDRGTVLLKPGPAITLKWSPVEGIAKFVVTVKGGQQKEVRRVIVGNELAIPDLGPGNYAWQVKPIFEAAKVKGRGKQAQILEAKSSAISRFRVELVKEALKFDENLDKLLLLPLSTEGSLSLQDYVCLYPDQEPSSGAVACGVVYAKKAQAASLHVLVQSQHLDDGGRYYLSDPSPKKKRSLASQFTPSNLYRVSYEMDTFDYDFTIGLSVGAGFLCPVLEGKISVWRRFALGLQYLYANQTTPDGSARLNGFILTATQYLGPRNFSGFFAEGGIGIDSFSTSTPDASQAHAAPVGLLYFGWQWRPSQQGFNVAISAGGQYIGSANLTLVPTKLAGLLFPVGSLSMGYAF